MGSNKWMMMIMFGQVGFGDLWVRAWGVLLLDLDFIGLSDNEHCHLLCLCVYENN